MHFSVIIHDIPLICFGEGLLIVITGNQLNEVIHFRMHDNSQEYL